MRIYDLIAKKRDGGTHSREELESCQFIREHKNLILYGPVGTGKTLAIAFSPREDDAQR